MFGYVAPLKSELKVREFEVYNAYYCAICRAVKRRYGELPRLLLSYDAVFVAMLADSLAEGQDGPELRSFRCFNNPLKKRNEVHSSPSIDYAADVMVLLGLLGLKDRKTDRDAQNPLKTAAVLLGGMATHAAGQKAAARLGEKARVCEGCLEAQAALEAAKEHSLDRAADPTGRMMAELLDFSAAMPDAYAASGAPELSGALRTLGYHLGRYIYIMDALEDLEKDEKTGAYNPLRLKPRPSEALREAVSLDLARMGEALSQLQLVYGKDIIENIIYLGLNAKLDAVFAPKN